MSSLQESPDLAIPTLLIHGKPYNRHEQHWYEEGNVGVLVGNTAFRLHRSILSRRSSVMSDLLRIPQPVVSIPENTNSEDSIIGIPFVELNDRVDDFAHVLDFIYPNSLPAAQTEHLGVKDLMGLVRFTGKYIINDLREWAVLKLGAEHLLTTENTSFKAALENQALYADPKFCVEVVRFSRECSLPKFLPLAVYALATAEWDRIPGNVSCLEQLSAEDRNRIHEGRLALSKAVLEKVSSGSENLHPKKDCTQDGCRRMIWVNPGTRWKGIMLHPLEELETRLTFGYPLLCTDCAANVVTQTRTFRDDVIGRLAEFFKL